MARSRRIRSNAVEVFYLQVEMFRELLAMETEETDLKKRAGEQPRHASIVGRYEIAAAVCRQLALGVRQIADGIAWRSLGYDRAVVHELSFGELSLRPHAAHLQPDTVQHEVAAAAAHVEGTGEIVILNNLTNSLRYGDFTSIGRDGDFAIHEVKAGKGSRKSGRATRQKRAAREVRDFIAKGERETRIGIQRILRLKTKPKNYLPALGDLISLARSKGSAHERLSDSLAVEVFDVEQMAQARDGSSGIRFNNPFRQSKDAAAFHSLDHFDKFSPNVAPYSVFPLADGDCVGLMSGELWLWIYINRGNLVRALKRRGLAVRVPSDDELKAEPKLMPGELVRHELDNPIVVTNHSQMLLLSFGTLGQIIHELLDEECFADTVQEQLEMKLPPALTYCMFEDEASLWD